SLPADTLFDVREVCKTLGLATADWSGGAPSSAPRAVIGGLEQGARRVPHDMIALVGGGPGMQLGLCAREPLVRPRVVIGDGRVCVLGPPIGRADIAAALRPAAAAPAIALDGHGDRHFEVLRRSHWIGWARGKSGPAISLHEQHGAT